VAPAEDTTPAEPVVPSTEPEPPESQQIEPTEQAGAEAAAVETDDAGETGMKPAPRIESGCRLDRDVLLASLMEVQNYLQQADVQEKTDESYLGRLSEMVHVLNADMNNLRAYCERAQTQLESIRDPIRDITDKIFKTIPVKEEEEGEQAEQRKYWKLGEKPLFGDFFGHRINILRCHSVVRRHFTILK